MNNEKRNSKHLLLLVAGMEGSKESTDYSDIEVDHLRILVTNFNQYRKDGLYTNLTLKVEGKEYACHKVVLAAVSPYFCAMFNSGMKESLQSTIELKDLKHKIFEAFLECAYTGKLQVSKDNVEELTKASNLLQCDCMLKICDRFF